MKGMFFFFILVFLASCSSQRLERKIADANWDALADETFLRWDNQRLKAASSPMTVVGCYKGKTSQTLELYKKEYLTRKDDPLYWIHVGNCYFVDEKWTKAEFFYQMALDEATNSRVKSIALNNLGLIHFRHEQWEKGREMLNKSIAASPRFKVPRFNLSQLYLQFGFYDKAVEVLSNSVFRGQKDIDVYFSLANAYLYKGDLKNAGAYFDLIPGKHLRREDIAATYALYLIRSGNLPLARQVLDDRERSGVPQISAISEKIEKLLAQRTKGE